jgi:hypothetical protein
VWRINSLSPDNAHTVYRIEDTGDALGTSRATLTRWR